MKPFISLARTTRVPTARTVVLGKVNCTLSNPYQTFLFFNIHLLTLNGRRPHRITSAWTLVTAAPRRLLGSRPREPRAFCEKGFNASKTPP